MGIVLLSLVICAMAMVVGLAELLGVSAGAPWAFRFGPTIATATVRIARPTPEELHARVTPPGGLKLWLRAPDRVLFGRPLMQFLWTPFEAKGTIDWVGPADRAVVRVRPLIGPVVAIAAFTVAVGLLSLAPADSDPTGGDAWDIRSVVTMVLFIGFWWVSVRLFRRRAYGIIQAIVSELNSSQPTVES